MTDVTNPTAPTIASDAQPARKGPPLDYRDITDENPVHKTWCCLAELTRPDGKGEDDAASRSEAELTLRRLYARAQEIISWHGTRGNLEQACRILWARRSQLDQWVPVTLRYGSHCLERDMRYRDILHARNVMQHWARDFGDPCGFASMAIRAVLGWFEAPAKRRRGLGEQYILAFAIWLYHHHYPVIAELGGHIGGLPMVIRSPRGAAHYSLDFGFEFE